jgi:hypothetical protein
LRDNVQVAPSASIIESKISTSSKNKNIQSLVTYISRDILPAILQFLEVINRNWSFRCARWSMPVIPKTNINAQYQNKISARRTEKNCIFELDIKHSPTSILRSMR